MGKIKHLGKFTDEGQFINLPFIFETGKYRVEIKPSGENRRDKTIYVDTDGIMKLPNYNGKKAFALGSNIFLIYKIVNGERVLSRYIHYLQAFYLNIGIRRIINLFLYP